MATKCRKVKTRRSCKNGKLKKPVRTKSGRKRRCKKKLSKKKSSRRKSYRMHPRKTNCQKCQDMINIYGLQNKNELQMARSMFYSDLARAKKHCIECAYSGIKNKSKGNIRNTRLLVPISERLKKAMEIQRKRSQSKESLPDYQIDDMLEYRILKLKR